MVDPGAGGDQVVDRGLALDREEAAHVVDAKVLQRGVQVDDPVLDPRAVQDRQDAFAHRREVRELHDVAESEDDAALVRDHHAGRVGAVTQEGGGALEQVRVPAVFGEVGAADHFPSLAGEDAIVALGGERREGRERQSDREGADRTLYPSHHRTTSTSTPSCPM